MEIWLCNTLCASDTSHVNSYIIVTYGRAGCLWNYMSWYVLYQSNVNVVYISLYLDQQDFKTLNSMQFYRCTTLIVTKPTTVSKPMAFHILYFLHPSHKECEKCIDLTAWIQTHFYQIRQAWTRTINSDTIVCCT